MPVRALSIVVSTLLIAFALGACSARNDGEDDITALTALHAGVLEAHRSGDVDAWMAHEADTVVSANRGVVSFSTASERRAKRTRYLGATTFSAYRDTRPPIVKVSQDGTLGWVIAEVQVKGEYATETGDEVPVDAIWAWIELYEKRAGAWKAIGNVSNRRPETEQE